MKGNYSLPPQTAGQTLVNNAFWTSLFRQVHLRGDGVLLEMVAGSVRGDTDDRKRPRGVRETGVHRRCVEHERRSSFKLLVHCRPIHLGSKVNNKSFQFLLGAQRTKPSTVVTGQTYDLYNNIGTLRRIYSNLLSASARVIGYGCHVLNCNHPVYWSSA